MKAKLIAFIFHLVLFMLALILYFLGADFNFAEISVLAFATIMTGLFLLVDLWLGVNNENH